ncbi:MAG: leucine--tRNA ligase, partial [Rhodobacteraceae bacterium]
MCKEPFSALFTQGMVTHEIYRSIGTRTSAAPDGSTISIMFDQYHLPEDVVFGTNKYSARIAMLRAEMITDGLDPENSDHIQGYIDVIDRTGIEIIPSAKMSKSKKNVVDPVNIISAFGADTARWFVMSDSPPERDVEWTSAGAEAAFKHLGRVWSLSQRIAAMPDDSPAEADTDLLRAMHRAIADCTRAIENFAFNKAIAELYAFTNTLSKSTASGAAQKTAMRTLAQLMAPMVPHLAEDIWARQDGAGLVAQAAWPKADPAMLKRDTITLPIQINGKRRSEIEVPADLPKDEVEKLALADDAVIKALGGGAPRKLIVVPGRIINVVV